MGIIFGYLSFICFCLLAAKAVTSKFCFRKADKALMEIHKFASAFMIIACALHVLFVIPALKGRKFLVMISGIISALFMILLICLCHMIKDRKRKMWWHRALTVCMVTCITGHFLMYIISLFFRLDFSQDYRAVTGVENILFQSNADRDSFYRRSFWGLERTDAPASYEPHNVIVSDRKMEPEAVKDHIGDIQVWQSVLSPDENYILYCEIEYNYKNTGVTDDEYCYYKVYNIETGEITVLYEAYREWYHLDWQ